MKLNYLIVLLLSVFNLAFSTNGTRILEVSATISGGTTFCQNSSSVVTFTGSGGIAPYTFNYTINGGAVLNVSSTETSSTVSLPVNSSATGTFTYTLVSVTDSSVPVLTQNVNVNTVFLLIPKQMQQ